MSRRVFDVGLDMGRIKNGLKLNKEGKHSKTARSASTSFDDSNNHVNRQLAVVPKLNNKRSVPNVHFLNLHEQQDPTGETVILPSPSAPIEPAPMPLHGFPRTPSHPSPPILSEEERTTGLDQRYSMPDPNLGFDLRPPPPNKQVKLLDTLSEQLLSGDHLNVILRDPSFFLRFTAFLNRYRPHLAPVLVRYLEAQKAMKAVEYANLVAQSIKPLPSDPSGQTPCPAASIDMRFEARAKKAFNQLVTEALPAYITQALVKVVTESMVREITGATIPLMQELVGGLAEVFCLSDPSVKDNPIIYASEEFYRTTQYGRDYAIGRNCRFLQGPKSDKHCVARMSAAVKSGQEFSEVLLNYRRDGSPFMNLLMIAPLYDNRGVIRYFIGAQVDISGLIEDGRGLDSFARYLEEKTQRPHRDYSNEDGKKSLRALDEFGQMLSLEESAVFKSHSRTNSLQDGASSTNFSMQGGTASRRRDTGFRVPRRVLGIEDIDNEPDRTNGWGFAAIGSSGKLPGVYQNYLLVRPYPSLRIVFVSSALRIPGLLQSPFLSRIGGPSHVRDGLADAFEAGAAVTAKVLWFPQGRPPTSTDNPITLDSLSLPPGTSSSTFHSNNNDAGDFPNSPSSSSRPTTRRGPPPHLNLNGLMSQPGENYTDNNNIPHTPHNPHNPHTAKTLSHTSAGAAAAAAPRTRYISCTPLLGSDDQVGVWIVIMVENEQITGTLTSREILLRRYAGEVPPTPSEYEREDNTLFSPPLAASSSAMAMENTPPVGGGGGYHYQSSGTG